MVQFHDDDQGQVEELGEFIVKAMVALNCVSCYFRGGEI